MAVVHGIDALDRSLGRLFVVVGVFDGLHLGHEYLLGELVAAAAPLDARPAVITFDHHPDEVLKGHAPPLLCDPAERLERLEAAGVAVTVVQHFDLALRETPYDVFVRRIADRVDLAGFLDDPGFRVRLRARRHPRDRGGAGRAPRLRGGRRPAVHPRWRAREQLQRSAPRSPPATSRPPSGCSAARTPSSVGDRGPARPGRSPSRCRSRCRRRAGTRSPSTTSTRARHTVPTTCAWMPQRRSHSRASGSAGHGGACSSSRMPRADIAAPRAARGSSLG